MGFVEINRTHRPSIHTAIVNEPWKAHLLVEAISPWQFKVFLERLPEGENMSKLSVINSVWGSMVFGMLATAAILYQASAPVLSQLPRLSAFAN